MEVVEQARYGGFALKDIPTMQQLIAEQAERVVALSVQINHQSQRLESYLS